MKKTLQFCKNSLVGKKKKPLGHKGALPAYREGPPAHNGAVAAYRAGPPGREGAVAAYGEETAAGCWWRLLLREEGRWTRSWR